MAYLSLKSQETVLDNVNNLLNPKQLNKKVATKRICNKSGSHFTNLSLIKPRVENVSSNVVVKPVHFVPKTTSIGERFKNDIECLGIFPSVPESNRSLLKTTCQKEREVKFLIKNPHEILSKEQKLTPDKIKSLQEKHQSQNNTDISMKSSVELIIDNIESSHKVAPIEQFSDKHPEVKSNFGANLKREVRYINLNTKKRSLDLGLDKGLSTSSHIISTSKENSTINLSQIFTSSERPSKVATGNIIRLPTGFSVSNTQSTPQIEPQNRTHISSEQSITRIFDTIKPKSNNAVVVEGKTHSFKNIDICPQSQGTIFVQQNLEIKEQPQKKMSVEQETQTEIYCWLYKNDNLYTVDIDTDESTSINHTVVPVQTVQIKPLIAETDNIIELISTDEKVASKDLFKEDCHQNISTKKNIYSLMSTLDHKDLTNGFQTAFIQDQTTEPYGAKTHSNNVNNSFFNNTNQIYENIHVGKLSKFSKDMRFPPSVRKLFDKICADIHYCQTQDAFGNTPLHQAVIDKNINNLKSQCIILKTIGAHLDHLNSEEDTALMIAVKLAVENQGCYEAVSLLVREGADQSVVDKEGCFPLLYAVKHGNLQLVNILLSAQDAQKVMQKFGHDGFAPLHLAAIGGIGEIINLLLVNGANVNVKDRKSGRTPYFHAVEKRNQKAVAVLLAYKADTYEPNLAGQLPPVIKATKLNQSIHSSPKICKSTVEFDYLNKVEIPQKLNSTISPCESSKTEIISEDGNSLSNLTNLEKFENDNLPRSCNFLPINRSDGIGSIKSYSKINESNTHSTSLKNNLITLSSKQLSSKPKVFKLLKPNPIVSRELVNKQTEQDSGLVIFKATNATRSVEQRDRFTSIIKTTLPVPCKSVEKLSATEDLKNCSNIIISRKTTLSEQNCDNQSSTVTKKVCGKRPTQKYTLANFLSRFDKTSNSTNSNTNERPVKDSENNSNKETSCVPDSNDNTTSNKSKNNGNKSSCKFESNNHENTSNLYDSNINKEVNVHMQMLDCENKIPTGVLDDPTNNCNSPNLELNCCRAEPKSAPEEVLVQNVCVGDQTSFPIIESSTLETEKIENTNKHRTVEKDCKCSKLISEAIECTIVDSIDEIEFCELDVVNSKQLVSDLYSNIEASSVIIGDSSRTSKNTIYNAKNTSDDNGIIGSDNVHLTFDTYLDNVVECNTINNYNSNGYEKFSDIAEVNCHGLQQQTNVGRSRKRSPSPNKPDSKNMSDEILSSSEMKRKRIKKL